MIFTNKQEALFEFVKIKHGNQRRKYTGEPYYYHLYNVASIVNRCEPGLIEIALCHDLIEDTDCKLTELFNQLVRIGYDEEFSLTVAHCAWELTDRFTKQAYPELNRMQRKMRECERLSTISYEAQSVKYADLIDNSRSIFDNDISFAIVYLKEKREILSVMNKGNRELYNICKRQIMFYPE